jgi:hypothetical protein
MTRFTARLLAATQARHGHRGRAHGQDARATVREIFAAREEDGN